MSGTAGWVRASYSPYGTQRLSGPSAWTGDRGWLGLVRDGATGLVQTGARLYDPLLQQFISPDPLLNPLAPNPYLYAGANPILFSDPTGLWFGESLWNSVVNSAPVQFAAGWHAQTVQWGISAAHTVVQAVRPGGSVSQSGRQVGAAVSSAAGKFGRDAVSSGSTQKAVGNLLGVDAAVSHGQAAIKSGQSGNWFNAGASAANAAGITASIAAIAIPGAGQLSTALRVGRYAKNLAQTELTAAKSISPLSIRFSQTSVRGVDEIAASMSKDGWVGDAIDVVKMPDGGLTTLDNTRVLAANRAGINVQANIRAFDEALPSEMLGRFTTVRGGTPTSWGDAVMNRIGGQNSIYRNRYPLGSPLTGWAGD